MNPNYQVSISDLMNFFSKEHEGFSEEDVQEAEKRTDAPLPPVFRQFLLSYGADSINDILHHINPPEDICTTYQCIEEELEEWDEEFQEAVQTGTTDDYAGNGYFDLWQFHKEHWNQVTENYVLIWYENQGVWNAGYLLSDLAEGQTNPPVYMSTEDDFITFEKCAENTEEFLLFMLFEASYEYEDAAERYDDPKEIQQILKEAGVELEQLAANRRIGACLKPDTNTLFLYLHRNEGQELVVVEGEKLDE